jgi:hypothetical protein
MKKTTLYFMVSIFSFCFVQTAWADDTSDLKDRIRQLEQENKLLKEKITAIESTEEEAEVIKQQATALPVSSKASLEAAGSLSYYFDSRDFNTIVNSVTNLPWRLSIWGFADFHSNQGQARDRFDPTRYFMEYRLSHLIDPKWLGGFEGLGLQAEYNDSNGSGNTLARFGVTYKHGLPLMPDYKGWLQWRAFFYETDGSGTQVSLGYNLPVTERISITGFADWNINTGGADRWIIEPQLNFMMMDYLHAVLEFRYNGIEHANKALRGTGVAAGLTLKF